MAKKKEDEPKGPIIIAGPNFVTRRITIIGTTSLISNRFSKKMMVGLPGCGNLDGERPPEEVGEEEAGKKPGAEKRPIDFEERYHDSLYPLPEGGYGFPAMGFKRAIVGGCRQTSQLEMTMANRIIFVQAPHVSITDGFVTECVRIEGEPRMRKDVGRNSNIDRTPRICCRGEFTPWWAELEIEFNANMICEATLLRLIEYGGRCEGIGEQRPSAKKAPGNNGRFRLAQDSDALPGTRKKGRK